MRYCGEYYDTESALIYLRARYYEPYTGRFISEDPAKDGGNWYTYCANDPISFIDPWGLEPGDLRLNWHTIGYLTEMDSGLYGSVRDIMDAYGGTIDTSTGIYKFNLKGYTFEMDVRNMNNGETRNLDIYKNGKKVKSSYFVQVADKDNAGYSKMLVNVQDFVDLMEEAGYSVTKTYELGVNGGCWSSGTNFGQTSYIIPADSAASYYSNGGASSPSYSVGVSDFITSAIADTIAGFMQDAEFNDMLNQPDVKYVNFYTLVEFNAADGYNGYPQIVPTFTTYFAPIKSKYYKIPGSTIGTFTPFN